LAQLNIVNGRPTLCGPGYFYSHAGASNWRNGPLQFESCTLKDCESLGHCLGIIVVE
ncbi:hypothetical protein K0M31_007515, partial [Melipona bicolor]